MRDTSGEKRSKRGGKTKDEKKKEKKRRGKTTKKLPKRKNCVCVGKRFRLYGDICMLSVTCLSLQISGFDIPLPQVFYSLHYAEYSISVYSFWRKPQRWEKQKKRKEQPHGQKRKRKILQKLLSVSILRCRMHNFGCQNFTVFQPLSSMLLSESQESSGRFSEVEGRHGSCEVCTLLPTDDSESE